MEPSNEQIDQAFARIESAITNQADSIEAMLAEFEDSMIQEFSQLREEIREFSQAHERHRPEQHERNARSPQTRCDCR